MKLTKLPQLAAPVILPVSKDAGYYMAKYFAELNMIYGQYRGTDAGRKIMDEIARCREWMEERQV